MIIKENFSLEHINQLHSESDSQPEIIERTLFAFGLLEAISRTGLDFIFKGGSCLMVLLREPKRFSTDIDIVVPPGTDIDSYIREAGQIFPFFHEEEQTRAKRNNIEKRHFKFLYLSPISNSPVTVLLDVLFEENHYSSVVSKTISNKLILTDGKDVEIKMPGINCILGDKLTAFAPHTTGIRIEDKKELEIIKQMFDCASLIKEITDFSEVKKTYDSIVKTEIAYRNLSISKEEVLMDTIKSSAVIVGRGSLVKSDDFSVYSKGIRGIQYHLLSKKYDMNAAGEDAALVMYLASSILNGSSDFKLIDLFESYKELKIDNKEFSKLNSLKKVDLKDFAYVFESLNNL